MTLLIEMTKENKVILRLPAEYYVKEIDSIIENALQNNDLECLNKPLGVLIHTVAAMDGDWDNGENKLKHAKKWMGPGNFMFFKELYPEKYKRLLESK